MLDCANQSYDSNQQKEDTTCYDTSHDLDVSEVSNPSGITSNTNQYKCNHLKKKNLRQFIMERKHIVFTRENFKYPFYSPKLILNIKTVEYMTSCLHEESIHMASRPIIMLVIYFK